MATVSAAAGAYPMVSAIAVVSAARSPGCSVPSCRMTRPCSTAHAPKKPPMQAEALIEKIQTLPPEQLAEVEGAVLT